MALLLSKYQGTTEGDQLGHYGLINEYRYTKGKPIDLSNRFLLERSDYPTGFHRFIYLLRIEPKFLIRFGKFLPTLMDALLLLLTGVSVWLFGGDEYVWLLLFPFLRMFWENDGRASHLSERAFGVFLGNLYLLLAVVIGYKDEYWLVPIVVGVFCLISVSSKFSIQATLFMSVFLSAVNLTPIYAALWVFSATLAAFLTRGYSWKVMRGNVRHSAFQRKLWSGPIKPVPYLQELFKVRASRSYLLSMDTNSILAGFINNPLVVVVLVWAVGSGTYGPWFNWAVGGLFLTLVISYSKLQFLGEPQRYLEYATVPTFVFLSNLKVSAFPLFLSLIAFVCLTLLIIKFFLLMRFEGAPTTRSDELTNLGDWASTLGSRTILTDPIRLSFYLGSRNRELITLGFFTNIGGYKSSQTALKLRQNHFQLSIDGIQIAEDYGVDLLVVEKSNSIFQNSIMIDRSYGLEYENALFAAYSKL